MAEQANTDEAAVAAAFANQSTAELLELVAAHLEGDPYIALRVLEARAVELDVADTPDAKLVLALAAAQAEFPSIPKTKTGEVRGTTRDGKPYSYEYHYADLGDVLGAVRPVLARHGLAVIQRTGLAGNLRTELRHVAGGIIDTEVELGQKSGNPQAFGGALTYLRRYELATLLGIAPEEDTDARNVPVNNNAGGQAAPPAALPPWATDLNRDRLAGELGPRLKVLLGDDGASSAARTIKDNLGGIPAIVSMTAGLVLDTMLAGNPDELIERLAAEQYRRRDAAAQAEAQAAEAAARAEAEAAQASAEAPDPPRYEDDVDEAQPADPTPSAAEQARAAAQAADEARAPADPALEEARKRAESTPAGKTAHPDLSGLTADEAVAALRGAGCVCPDPLRALEDETVRVDECPIMGHGIPF